MQKKLIALAVAGLASSAAFAQVTVYGVLDGTFDSVSVSSPVAAGDKLKRTSRVSANSSYFGLKGSEDLGGGNSALFQFEIGTGFDSGAALSTSRDSFVGLKSDAIGTVLLGQLTGPTRALGAAVDVYAGATGIGTNGALIGKLGNGILNANGTHSGFTNPAVECGRSSTCVSTFDSRWKNAIAYVSPTFAGFNFTAAVVANENRTEDGNATQLDTKGTDFGVKYVAGPLMAAVTLNTLKLGDAASSKASNLRAGAKYDFGVAAVSGMVDQTKFEDNVDRIKQRVFGVGVQVPVGMGKVVGQYYSAGDVRENGVTTADSGAKLITVGYEHSLTKRTMVKVVYARVNNEDLANYDFGVNSVGIANYGNATTGAATTNGGGEGASVRGLSLGIRHTF